MSIKNELSKILLKNEALIDTASEQVNDLHAVRSFMMRRIAEHELSPTQQKKIEIYEFIYNQLIGRKWSELELIELIKSKYKCPSRPMAVSLLNDTKELFTTVLAVNKQWELKQQVEACKAMMRKAELTGDFKAYAALEKNFYKMLELVEEVEVAQDDFVGHTMVITADPSVIGVKAADPAEVKLLMAELKEKFGFEDATILEE